MKARSGLFVYWSCCDFRKVKEGNLGSGVSSDCSSAIARPLRGTVQLAIQGLGKGALVVFQMEVNIIRNNARVRRESQWPRG